MQFVSIVNFIFYFIFKELNFVLYIIKTEKTIKLFSGLVSSIELDSFNFVHKYRNLLSVYLSDSETFTFFPRVRKYKWKKKTSDPLEAESSKRKERIVSRTFVKLDNKSAKYYGFTVPRPSPDLRVSDPQEIVALQLNKFLSFLEKSSYFFKDTLYIRKDFFKRSVKIVKMSDFKQQEQQKIDEDMEILVLEPYYDQPPNGKTQIIGHKKPTLFSDYHPDINGPVLVQTRTVVSRLLDISLDEMASDLGVTLCSSQVPLFDVNTQNTFEYSKSMIQNASHTHYKRENFLQNREKFHADRKYPFAQDFGNWSLDFNSLLHSLGYFRHYQRFKSEIPDSNIMLIEALRSGMVTASSPGSVERNRHLLKRLDKLYDNHGFTTKSGYKSDYLPELFDIYESFFESDSYPDTKFTYIAS